MLFKEAIHRNFSRASSSYEQVATVQKACAQRLVDLLKHQFPSFVPESILDVGTGTGFVVNLLKESFPNSNFTLNDLCPAMVARAAQKLARHSKAPHTMIGDMETLPFPAHDLITSNVALHWAEDSHSLISKLYKQSSILAFSCPVEGTFAEWAERFDSLSGPSPVCSYPSPASLKAFLSSLNPTKAFYHHQQFTLTFPNPRAFMHYLKALGANLGTRTLSPGELKKILISSNLIVSYKMFFALLRRS